MPKKLQFKNYEEMLAFSKQLTKRIVASSKGGEIKFEKEKKAWEEYECSYNLELEKKKHATYLKDLQKIIRGQKSLIKRAEHVMRQSEKLTKPKAKKYKPTIVKSAFAAEPLMKYKNKEK